MIWQKLFIPSIFCLISYKHSESCSIHVQLLFPAKDWCCFHAQLLAVLVFHLVSSPWRYLLKPHICVLKLQNCNVSRAFLLLQTRSVSTDTSHFVAFLLLHSAAIVFFTSWSLQQPNKQVHQLHFLKTFLHSFMPLCHILVSLTVMQAFSFIILFVIISVISDIWFNILIIWGQHNSHESKFNQYMLCVFWLLHQQTIPIFSPFLRPLFHGCIIKIRQLITPQGLWVSK